jgi:hypothetical protein
MVYNPTFVMFSSWKFSGCNSLNNKAPCSDDVGAYDPGLQEERSGFGVLDARTPVSLGPCSTPGDVQIRV